MSVGASVEASTGSWAGASALVPDLTAKRCRPSPSFRRRRRLQGPRPPRCRRRSPRTSRPCQYSLRLLAPAWPPGCTWRRRRSGGRRRPRPCGLPCGSPDHDGLAGDSHGDAEAVVLRFRSQPGHLDVRGAAVIRAKDVGRAPLGGGVVDVVVGSDHDSVAVDRHRAAEVVVLPGICSRQLELRVRGPAVGRAKDVGRSIVIVAVASGPDHDGAAVDRHG